MRGKFVAVVCLLFAAVAVGQESKPLTLSGQAADSDAALSRSEVDAAALVRAVRESENWIHEVNSLYLRIESRWTRTPEGIAARRAELQKMFPDQDWDPNRFTNLKPSSTGSLEFAISKERLRFLNDAPGEFYVLRIWDGNQAISHENYIRSRQEHYYLGATPERIFASMLDHLSWLRSQPRSFWWHPIDVEAHMERFGYPEDFVITGFSNWLGVDCHILEWKRNDVVSYRWYVGAKDRRLYGHVWLMNREPEVKHWTLHYKEIAPGCWFPMTQGYEIYEADSEGKRYLKSRRDLKVEQVRINEQPREELFTLELKEGVRVVDERSGETVTYTYRPEPPELVGKALPPFEGIEVAFAPETSRGRMILVCFWDMQQRPSRNCIMQLAKQAEQLKQNGVTIVAVQASKVDGNTLDELVKKNNIPFPVGMVQDDAEKSRFNWAVKSLPWLILTNRQHIVVAEGFAMAELDEKLGHRAKN